MRARCCRIARAAILGIAATAAVPAAAGPDDPGLYGRVRISVANAPADLRLARVRSALSLRFAPENLTSAAAIRVLSVRPRPDDPGRFDATIYDSAKERGFELVLDAEGRELARQASLFQPAITNDEVREALGVVTNSARFAAAIAAGTAFVYEAMPPVLVDKEGRRLINVGVMSRPAGSWNAVENEIVSVHLPSKQVLRNEGGAPPTAVAGLGVCGPTNQGCGASSGSCDSVYHFEWPAVDPVWKFDALHPSCTGSVQGDGTGLELRNVKYRDHLVLKTVHMPVLNVEYVGNVCGPYRDWLDTENCFATAGTPVGTTGFAVSSGAPAPSTFCESGSDAGNFMGVAIHDDGDSLWLLTETSAGWYRYVLEYRLHLDGTFEPIMGFGATANGCTCNAHNHHGYWRMEFALDGSESDPATGIATLDRLVPGTTDQWTPIQTETKLTRPAAGWTEDRLRIRNPVTGIQYTLVPGLEDGSAEGDAYAKGDTWALANNSNQINDPNADTSITIDSWMNGEALGAAKRLVLWYRVGYFHDHAGGDLEPCELTNPKLIFRQSCQGRLSFSQEAASCAASLTVALEDSDLAGTGTQIVSAHSATEPAGEAFVLTETPPGSGTFTGQVLTSSDPAATGDGRVSVVNGDQLAVDYDDVDACGTPHVAVQKTMPVDCTVPILSNLRVATLSDTAATLAWETNEPADSEAAYGTAPPPSATTGNTEALQTSHSIELSGLTACTHYVYSATSQDRAGNVGIDDNSGAYHSFDTFGPTAVFGPDDVEQGASDWTVTTTGGSAWHVTTCKAASASHAWKAGSSAGCPGSYAANTDTFLASPLMALGAGTGHSLHFQEYVSTQAGNDLGRVQISTTQGATWTTLEESTGLSGGWHARVIDLSAYAGQTIKLRFWFHSDGTSAIEGWYLDDIEVLKAVPCGAYLVEEVSTTSAVCPAGGSDGAIDPGEDVTLAVQARNIGLDPATNVHGTLTASTPGVYVTGPTAAFSDAPAGGASASAAPHFAFTVDAAVACSTALHFDLHLSSDQGQWVVPLVYQVGSGGSALVSISSVTTPRAIPDVATTNDSLYVSSAGTLTDVNVSLSLTHTYDADLKLTLVSPGGTRVELSSDNGGAGDDYAGTTFDDDAPTSIAANPAPFTGSFRPEAPLSVLNGEAAGGTWTLEIVDDTAADSGTLQSWSVSLTTLDPLACTGCAVVAPGEVVSLEWAGLDTLQWTPVGEGRWYELLRGDLSRLAPLTDAGLDGCVRWTGTDGTTGPILQEVPGLDELYWYLLSAWNGAGRGDAGSATAGPRVIDPDGPCP